MGKTIDARRLNCPQPVILTKKAMDEGGVYEITTIVDNATALENVKKLASSQGYDTEVEEKNGEFYIRMSRPQEAERPSPVSRESVAVLITSSLLGKGDEELGRVLMKSFLYTLSETEGQVKHLIFMNSGVFLTTEGSPVLDHLAALEAAGVEILSCGTCLDYYGLKKKLAVGSITNMYTAVETLFGAARVITI